MKRIVMIAACTALMTGCSPNGSFPPGNPATAIAVAAPVPALDGVTCRAVVWGLDHVNPAAYGGSWRGECPGTILDALRMRDLLASRGYQVMLLTNEQATSYRIVSACVASVGGMRDGDKFVAYGSSHGGQVTDVNGDEGGGKDSTICLWDGQFTDDLVGEMLLRIKANIDVDLILDCCNSGTMMRGPHDYVRVFRARQHAKGFDIKCNLTYYGGCGDGKSSYGGEDGGAFTKCLLDNYSSGITRLAWFDAVAKRMPRNQAPVFAKFGPKDVSGESALK